MLMDTFQVPTGIPFEPYGRNHTLALRYTYRQLVDDIAGESVPRGVVVGSFVCASDLPAPVRIVRLGMQWPHGLALPSDTLVVVIDDDSVIRYVGYVDEDTDAAGLRGPRGGGGE
ncbi:hypothetical protein IWQ56_005578 [Coemansia nantahalensis]|nr:hypothetical protein IWQ56_005578 [Coemansia nantahalensis]